MQTELNEFETITYRMIEAAARDNKPCPSNLDIEMELGCNSTSVAPTVVKMLETKGLIRVTRYQRAREVEIIKTGQSTAPHPDRKTNRKHVPRGMKGRTCHTDRKPYRSVK
tara:strand:- start:1093 stop:1425 length:333 start_codon:yes stop_codon:yes gene_type:complete